MKLNTSLTLSGYCFMMLLLVTHGFTINYPKTSPHIPTLRPCPTRCKCSNTTINCSGLGLQEIPNGLPSDTTVLNFSHNRIEQILVRRLLRLKNLRELYLQGNKVAFIPSDTWFRLLHLKILDLSANPIVCNCPLHMLEKHLYSLQWNVNFIHKNKSDCRQSSVDKCMLKQRWKRKPSCEALGCMNGGICIYSPELVCQCVPCYSGRYCELGPGNDRIVPDSKIMINIDRVTSTTILISWVNPGGPSETPYRIDVFLVSSAIAVANNPEPIETVRQSYLVESLYPGALYRICVTVEVDTNEQQSCVIQQTLEFDAMTTPKTKGRSKDVYVQGNDPHDPRDQLPKPSRDSDGGQGVNFAFISVAAVFGVSLMLMVLTGFAYYKRVHTNTPPDPEDDDEDAVGDRPPTNGDIATVSMGLGNELSDGGLGNPIYEGDSNIEGAIAIEGNTNQVSQRSVRFTLPDQSAQQLTNKEEDDNTVNEI